MKQLQKFVPILEWLPQYNRQQLKGDLFAGMTVGVMLVPQGMAYALIAGLPPVYGLYAALVPQVVYAIFGTSRQLAVGPVAMDSLLVAAGVGMLASEGTATYIQFALLTAALMGLIQLTFGLVRMGFITNLLSRPVISGFTSAAAIIIGLNQLKYLFGFQLIKSNQVHEILLDVVGRISEIHLPTFLLGIAGIVVIILAKRVGRTLPGSLIAVVIGTLFSYSVRGSSLEISIVGAIPEGLPSFVWTFDDWATIRELLPLSLTIAVVAFMEGFSVAKAMEAQNKNHKLSPNQELVSLGLANFIGSLFQSYPVAGGFSRTAVNHQSGARTPMSLIISAFVVMSALLFLTPLLYHLPHAILASIIMMAVSSLIDWRYARKLAHDSKLEFALLIGVMLVTLSWGLVQGIIIGVVLSVLIILYRMAYPHIAILGRIKGHTEFRNLKRFQSLDVWPHLLIMRIDAPITFINIQYVKDFISERVIQSAEPIEAVIIDAGPISYLDATGVQGLEELVDELSGYEIRLLLSDVVGPVRDRMSRSGLMRKIGQDNVYLSLDAAVSCALNHSTNADKVLASQANEQE